MSAASAPVICGTSACCASTMLTFTEPENTGPRITYGSLSIAFCTCAREMPGLLCVSDWGALILRFRIPPLALISSIASTAPSRKLVPDTAPAPESSITIGMFTVCCAAALPIPSVNIAPKIPPSHGFIALLLHERNSFWRLRDDVGLDELPQFRRHPGVAAEPFPEAESRLLQQHAQAVDRAVAALSRLRQDRGLEGHVDDVVDDRAFLERREIDLERVLALHAERGAVHEHVGLGQQFRQVIPLMSARAETPRQLLRARQRAVDDVHFDAALPERID